MIVTIIILPLLTYSFHPSIYMFLCIIITLCKKSIILNINVMIALLFFIIHNLDVVTFDAHLTS